MVLKKLCCILLLGTIQSATCSFKLGIENIPQPLLNSLYNKKIGLVVNQTSCDQTGKKTVEVLQNLGVNVGALLVPEHGLNGSELASQEILNGVDSKTKLPIVSLYAKGTGKKIDGTMIGNFDVLIFDIQDSGMRHYTYISTLYRLLEAAALHKKPVIVLDRPNPLGARMEGPLVEPDLISFISIAPIPLRHGMTIGELARYFNEHVLEKKALLTVVPMRHYLRNQIVPSTISFNLSPNIQSRASCYGYSFLGLLGEIKPCDVSVGSNKAFQTILLPEGLLKPTAWHVLKNQLHELGIASIPYQAYNDKKKSNYSGLRIMIEDVQSAQSWKALLTIIAFFKNKGIPLHCSKEFDKAIGTRSMRSYIEGDTKGPFMNQELAHMVEQFFIKAKTSFLYAPLPTVASS